jgi:hypothetical protein
MTITASTPPYRPHLWTTGDLNAFFGFGTNILVNMLVLTGLLRFVIKMPDAIVFGRILPALGLMLCLSTFYYAFLAYRLGQKTDRSDVCALPSGVSVPHMFVVTFVIMLPIALKTNDPVKGWEAGLVWVFFQSFILMIGGFIAPYVRRITPRAALLGTLAGVSITFISMRPALEMYMTPVIGLTCFAVILVSWFGGFKRTGNGTASGTRRRLRIAGTASGAGRSVRLMRSYGRARDRDARARAFVRRRAKALTGLATSSKNTKTGAPLARSAIARCFSPTSRLPPFWQISEGHTRRPRRDRRRNDHRLGL